MWFRALAILVLLQASLADRLAAVRAQTRPVRVVSLNQCTDLLLLGLAEPERIASITFVTAQSPWTPPALAGTIRGLATNRGLAEEIAPLKPDLVVAGAFSASATTAMLRRMGYRVETFMPENSLADVRASIRRMGELLGEQARAEDLVRELDRAIAAAAPTDGQAVRLADIGANGWMAGSGTLMSDVAEAAGLETLGDHLGVSGYAFLSLEEVIVAQPRLLAFIDAWSRTASLASGARRHPAYGRLAKAGAHAFDLPERLVACGSPQLGEAVLRLAEARSQALRP